MAAAGGEEVEYESDPEELKRSLTMRRREASDDEEEKGREGEERERIDSRGVIESDAESDGQGAPAEYDEEGEESEIEEEDLEELEEDEEEEDEVEVEVEVEREVVVGGEYVARGDEDGGEVGGDVAADGGDGGVEKELDQGVQEEKRESQPFSVPTAGAFYMHDDRFRDNAGGRHSRRTLGGRKLWESKDDRKWGHDKFEAMKLQERHYEQGTRNSRGHYRARENNRGADRRYPRGGNKSKAYNNNNQNQGPMVVRGRGPTRYEPSGKNNSGAPPTQPKHYGKPTEKTLQASSGRAPIAPSNSEPNPGPAGKQVVASSLSSASPPFYPSTSSNKEITTTQKRVVQTINRNIRSSGMDGDFSISQTNTMMRGKNVVGSIGMENLSISPISGRPSTSLQLPSSGSSLVNTSQPLQPRSQGRGIAPSGQMSFQPRAPHNQVSRASPPTQLQTMQRNPVQLRVQPSLQVSGQQLAQSPGSGSQTSSPPKAALSINSFESGELESLSESSKSKTALVGKGRGTIQGSGRGPFLYSGAQFMGTSGNMGSGHGDQNFGATPAFFPVMPFGGQHPGGVGVPAVGMAFPGYVAQPQRGSGNPEMTWLPVLAGAAGALGATYGSPYIAFDGAYHSRPSGQTSSSVASSKENSTNKPNNEWKPPQRPEGAGDEFGQRQKNTRRYTEMNFGQ